MSERDPVRRPPRLAAAAAYVSAAIAIFFAAYIVSVDRRLTELEAELGRVRRDVSEVRAETTARRESETAAPAPQATPGPGTDGTGTPEPATETAETTATPGSPPPPETEAGAADETTNPTGGAPAETAGEAPEAAGPGTPVPAPGASAAEPSGGSGPGAPAAPEGKSEPEASEARGAVVRAVEADPTRPDPGPEETGLQARVLEAGPDGRRFFVDAGRADGVRPGQRFTVWRDGTYVGELRAATVFRSMSACEVTTRLEDGIRYGDTARAVPLRLLNTD